MNNKKNKLIPSYLFLVLWLHVETSLIVLSDVQKYSKKIPSPVDYTVEV